MQHRDREENIRYVKDRIRRSRSDSWYLWFAFSTTHSIFPLPSASTLAGEGSLLDGITETLIPEGAESLVILSFFDCFSFPLTSVIGHGSTRMCSRESPGWQTQSFLLLLCYLFPLVIRITLTSKHLLCHWFNGMMSPKKARWQSHLPIQQNRCCIPMREAFPLED